MKFLKRRRLNKIIRHVLHEARHARHMREDITPVELLEQLDRAAEALRDAWPGASLDVIEERVEKLCEVIRKVQPPKKAPHVRENIEVLVVALVVAMAFRTYFVQPFKIPTGSMQPTLNGITFHPPSAFTLLDRYPLRLLNLAIGGTYPVRIHAVADGVMRFSRFGNDSQLVRGVRRDGNLRVRTLDTHFEARYFTIGNIYLGDQLFELPVPTAFELHVEDGDFVRKGDVLASGTIQYGDHIFVNKVKYNFARPRRGDVVVFDTSGIDHPDIMPDSYYIKRLVGLPGETIGINRPDDPDDISSRWLLVDGEPVRGPYPFDRLLNAHEEGYEGYVHVYHKHPASPRPKLAAPGDVVTLGSDEFLAFGDNTQASLDSRYFGAIKCRELVGPAFAVYWPFTRRWARVR